MILASISLFDISLGSAIVPIIVGITYYRKMTVALKFIFYLVTLSLSADILSRVFIELYQYSLIVINALSPFHFALIGLYFFYIPSIQGFLRNIIKVIFGLSIVYAILDTAFSDIIGSLNNDLLSMRSVTVIIYCFIYFYNLVKNELNIPLWLSPYFYVNSGLLLYHTSTFALFVTFGYFEYEVDRYLWMYKLAGYIFLNILISVGFYTLKYKKHE